MAWKQTGKRYRGEPEKVVRRGLGGLEKLISEQLEKYNSRLGEL